MRLYPWPWSRAFLSLASRGSVLGRAVRLALASDFFVSLVLISSLVSSIPPLTLTLYPKSLKGEALLELFLIMFFSPTREAVAPVVFFRVLFPPNFTVFLLALTSYFMARFINGKLVSSCFLKSLILI